MCYESEKIGAKNRKTIDKILKLGYKQGNYIRIKK